MGVSRLTPFTARYYKTMLERTKVFLDAVREMVAKLGLELDDRIPSDHRVASYFNLPSGLVNSRGEQGCFPT